MTQEGAKVIKAFTTLQIVQYQCSCFCSSTVNERKKRLLSHILQILEQSQVGLRWMARRTCGGIDIVRCWLQRSSRTWFWLLVMPGEAGCWLLLCRAQRFAELGLHLPFKDIVPIRQACDYEIRCHHRCLLPWGENKDIDRYRNSPAAAKAAQPFPVGRLLRFGFHWAIHSAFWVYICLADQGSGLAVGRS